MCLCRQSKPSLHILLALRRERESGSDVCMLGCTSGSCYASVLSLPFLSCDTGSCCDLSALRLCMQTSGCMCSAVHSASVCEWDASLVLSGPAGADLHLPRRRERAAPGTQHCARPDRRDPRPRVHQPPGRHHRPGPHLRGGCIRPFISALQGSCRLSSLRGFPKQVAAGLRLGMVSSVCLTSKD